ncbi:MAG: NAD(P)H-dependent oxidoreductase [Methanotrichaceae archaeon]
MTVVGISGSPRKGGNTEFLLDEALKTSTERGFQTDRLLCSELEIDYCRDCGGCSKGKPLPDRG